MKRVHAEKKDVICDKCGSTFNNLTSLKGHIKEKHRQYLLCSYCDKRFSHKANLKVHERTHTGERPFSCQKCDKRFGDLSNLISHEKTHIK